MGEFERECEALNLEGCVGLRYQAQLDFEGLRRVLNMIYIRIARGAA
jgi:hypothetical protein